MKFTKFVILKNTAVRYFFDHLNDRFYILDTTQLLFIKLQPIDNGLNFTCHYRPNSSLWGCGILVKKSTKTISINETIGTITNLCPGEYNVAMFYVKDGMDYVIEYATVNISGTSCLLISEFCLSFV